MLQPSYRCAHCTIMKGQPFWNADQPWLESPLVHWYTCACVCMCVCVCVCKYSSIKMQLINSSIYLISHAIPNFAWLGDFSSNVSLLLICKLCFSVNMFTAFEPRSGYQGRQNFLSEKKWVDWSGCSRLCPIDILLPHYATSHVFITVYKWSFLLIFFVCSGCIFWV